MLEVSAGWLEAMERVDRQPGWLVVFTVAPGEEHRFLSYDRNSIGTSIGLAEIEAQNSQRLDPITRKVEVGAFDLTFVDDTIDTNYSRIRDLVRSTRLKGKRVDIYVGEHSLDEATYTPLALNLQVDEIVPGPGFIRVTLIDAFAFALDSAVHPFFWPDHPFAVARSLMERVAPSAVIDADSLDETTHTDISHFVIGAAPWNHSALGASFNSSFGIRPEEAKELNAYELINEILFLAQAGLVPNENGEFQLRRAPAIGAAQHHFSQHEIRGFKQRNIFEGAVNRVSVYGRARDGRPYLATRATDEEAAIDASFTDINGVDRPTISERHFPSEDKPYPWLNAYAMATTPAPGATTLVVPLAQMFGFCGTLAKDADGTWNGTTQLPEHQLSATRPAYLFLYTDDAAQGELVRCTAPVTLSPLSGPIDSLHLGSRQFAVNVTYTIERDVLGTGELDPGSHVSISVCDVTIAIWLAQTIVRRLSRGLPRVSFDVPIANHIAQISDTATFDEPTYIEHGVSGADETVTWELIEKKFLGALGYNVSLAKLRSGAEPTIVLDLPRGPGADPLSPGLSTSDGDVVTTGSGLAVVDLTIDGETWGDLLYRGEDAWLRLPAGTPGYVLSTNGPGAAPTYINPNAQVSLQEAYDVGRDITPGSGLPVRIRGATLSGASPDSTSLLVVDSEASCGISILTGASSYGAFYIGSPAQPARAGIYYENNTGNLGLRARNTDAMSVTTGANWFGFGLPYGTDALAKVHIRTGAGSGATATASGTVLLVESSMPMINVLSPNGGTSGIMFGTQSTPELAGFQLVSASSRMAFYYAGVERLGISTTGTIVGAPTSSFTPFTRFHVVGAGGSGGTFAAFPTASAVLENGGNALFLFHTGNANVAGFYFRDPDNGASQASGAITYSHSTNTLSFVANEFTRFAINASGAFLVAGAPGTAGQVLVSGGSASTPSWTSLTVTGFATPTVEVASDASTFTAGVATTALRSDARLIADTAAAVSITGTTTNGLGAAATLARSDHTHAFNLAGQATGDLMYAASATTWGRVPIGTANQLIHVAGGAPVYTSNIQPAQVIVAQAAQTGTVPAALRVTGAAHTAMTAGTAYSDVVFNFGQTKTFAAGAITSDHAFWILPPTFAADAPMTIGTANTLAINGPPAAGTNVTITNAYALNVLDGRSRFGTSNALTSELVLIEQVGAGDAMVRFFAGAQSFSVGIDNSDADRFKVSQSTALGTTDRFWIGPGSAEARFLIGTTGIAAAASGTVLTIDNSGDAYLSILTPNNAVGGIYFGDPESTTIGSIRYNHTSNAHEFYTGGYYDFVSAVDVRIQGQLRIAERVGDPGNVANTGFLYVKDVGTLSHLFYMNSAGNTYQLTPTTSGGGTLDAAYDFGGAGAGRSITVDTGAVLLRTATLSGGTAAASTLLHLDSNGTAGINIHTGTASTGFLYFGDSGGAARGGVRYDHAGTERLELLAGGNIRAHVQATGVGIGDGIVGLSVDSALHVMPASAGTVTAAANTVITAENSTDAIVSILTPNNAVGAINFGDPQNASIGRITYTHSSDTLGFTTNGTSRVTIDTAAVTSALPVVVPLGSGAFCGLAFSGDTNTGLIGNGSGQITMVCDGTSILRCSTADILPTRPIRHSSVGSSGAPSYSWNDDTDTGLWRFDSDVLGFAGGGFTQLSVQGSATSSQHRVRFYQLEAVSSGTANTILWSFTIPTDDQVMITFAASCHNTDSFTPLIRATYMRHGIVDNYGGALTFTGDLAYAASAIEGAGTNNAWVAQTAGTTTITILGEGAPSGRTLRWTGWALIQVMTGLNGAGVKQ